MMHQRLNYLLLFLTILLLQPRSAHACSCAFGPAKTEIERLRENLTSEYVGAVFVGAVQQARLENPDAESFSSIDPVFVTFSVDQVFKGKVAHQFTLTTARFESSCGFDFREGATYLVFVRETSILEGQWNSGLCDGNELYPSALTLAALGESYAPSADGTTGQPLPEGIELTPLPDVVQPEQSFFSNIGMIELTLAVGILAVVIWLRMRR